MPPQHTPARLGGCAAACLFGIFTVACASVPAAPADRAIHNTLDAYHAAAARADGRRYLNLMTHDSVFLGTAAEERWTKEQFRAFASPYFAEGKGWTYLPIEGSRTVTLSPDASYAWFDELLRSEKYGLVRGSGVVREESGGWKIAQYNLHFPIPNEIAGEVVELVRRSGGSREHQPDDR